MAKRIAGNAAFLALVALVALRPLTSETYDSAQSSMNRALGALADPTPLRTLILDVVILVAALVVALAQPRRIVAAARGTGLTWGFALIVVAGVVSCMFAGNKRLAINATIDWLCLPVLAITLVSLLRGPWQRRLLMVAIIGGAAVQVLECGEQFTGIDDTIAHYEQNKNEFWKSQGVELDAPQVAMFEARMRAREVFGFMPHSNVTGSYILLAAFCGIGLCIDRLRRWRGERGSTVLESPSLRRLAGIACLVVTVAILATIPLTGSRGAMLAGAGAGVLWTIAFALRRVVNGHRRGMFIAGWVGFAVIGAAAVGHGLYHKSLPGVSLTFRWQYWTASTEMIADHPWTGVGRENFGRNYLQYKSIRSPEEVSNPHNLFVQAAADWGLLGLLGLVMLLVGGSRAVVLGDGGGARPMVENDVVAGGRTDGPLSAHAQMAVFLAMTLLVVGLRVPLLGTDDPNFVFYKSVTGAMAWLIGAGAVWFAWGARTTRTNAGASERSIAAAVAWGLLAFLVHDLINFALFVPATATTFFALFAYVISTRRERDSERPKGPEPLGDTKPDAPSWYCMVCCAVALCATLWFGLIPVARSGARLAHARSLAQNIPVGDNADDHPAKHAFETAAEADPLDPTPLAEQGLWLGAVAAADPPIPLRAADDSVDSLTRATRRDPHNASLYRAPERVYLLRADETHFRADFDKAIQSAREALACYPQDPSGLVSLADALADAGEALDDPALSREAIETYQAALDLDDQRIEWETLRRFSPRVRAELTRKLESAPDAHP